MITRSSGFTLIELLVVVALIGIISAIGTISYQGYVSGAKKSSAKNILQQISLAEQENYSNTGEYYISSSSALSTNCSATATTSSQIEDMLFGNADGVLNDFDQDPPVIDDPDMLPNDIGYEFCVFGAKSVSYTIEAQSTDCVITLSKNGGIVMGDTC